MRLSREKLIRLSHVVVDQLVANDAVDFIEDRETIRQNVLQTLQALMKEEERVESEVRKKILSQKKAIPEGSAEWDVLFRKYYGEELRKHGISDVS